MEGDATGAPDVTLQYGLAALQAGRIDEAIEILARVATSQPQNAAAHQYLGIAFAQKGQWEHSLASLTTAARLNPMDARVRYNLGEVYRQMGRVSDARHEYREALGIDPAYTAPKQALAALPTAVAPPAPFPPAGMHPPSAPAERAAPAPTWRRIEVPEEPVALPQLCRRIITSPSEALEYDLPRYVRSHRAVLNIALFYAICIMPGIAVQAIRAATAEAEDGVLAAASLPAGIIAQVVGSVLLLVVQSGAISLVNVVIGRSEGFLADTAELALRFALVGGTTQLVGYSVSLLVTLGSLIAAPLGLVLGALTVITGFWTLYLFILVVMVTYDYSCIGAILVIVGGSVLLWTIVAAVLAAIRAIL